MTIGSFLEKKKISEFITQHNMLTKGDGVVLGLSGGPDSVCLFFVMLELAEKYDLKIFAVHINHCIRGKEADADQSFVEKLCEKYNIPLVSDKIDIPARVQITGRSVEEEARIARYEAFETCANTLEEEGINRVRIAVAHNADDNAETVIFHMARGCGLDGVCGIAPVRGRIIRPLLETSKAEIVSFLETNDLEYCIDKTNASVEYDRNRIRHNVIPELTQINEQALRHITNMSEILQEVADYLRLEAEGLLVMAKEEDGAIRRKTILTAPKVLQGQAIKLYLSRFMPDEKDVSQVHIDAVLSLLGEDGEKYVDLPHGKRLVLSYEKMFVIDQEKKEDSPKGHFETRKFAYTKELTYPQNTYTKWFDCDKIAGDIVIRTRQEGDYLIINSDGGSKSISDYFVNAKVPRSQRDQIPLVCDGHHVLWVVGYRISEYYKITQETTNVVEIRYVED